MNLSRASLRSLFLLALPVAGCVRAPAIDVEGSFIPSWMICLGIGSLGGVAVYTFVSRMRAHDKVAPAILFYPGIVVSVACLVWLFMFR